MTMVIWALWGASFALMAGVTILSARLAKNEEDQLCLSDSSSNVKSEQDAIAARLKKIQPLKYTSLALLGAMTLLVVVYYVFDMVRQFK